MSRTCLIPGSMLLCLTVTALTWTAIVAADTKTAEPSAAVTPAPRAASWWMDRHRSINERVQAGNVDLIWIGDSITQGWETAGAKVWQEFYGNRRAVNLGFSGDQTQHVLWRSENGNVNGIAPKVAVIMIGTNNSNDDDFSVDEISDGVKAIVKLIREKLPETRVLLLGIFPRGARPNAQRDKISAVNEKIETIADATMIRYANIADAFLEKDGSISREIMPDTLHLSPKGYQLWAKAIEPIVAEMLEEMRPPESK